MYASSNTATIFFSPLHTLISLVNVNNLSQRKHSLYCLRKLAVVGSLFSSLCKKPGWCRCIASEQRFSKYFFLIKTIKVVIKVWSNTGDAVCGLNGPYQFFCTFEHFYHKSRYKVFTVITFLLSSGLSIKLKKEEMLLWKGFCQMSQIKSPVLTIGSCCHLIHHSSFIPFRTTVVRRSWCLLSRSRCGSCRGETGS